MYLSRHQQDGLTSKGNTNRKPRWRVALVANLKDELEHEADDPPDAGAEFEEHAPLRLQTRLIYQLVGRR